MSTCNKRLLAAAFAALLSGCATRRALEDEATSRRMDARSTAGNVLIVEDRVNSLADRMNEIYKRVDAIERSVLGDWNRPECEMYSRKARKLFCRRVKK